MLVTDQPEGIPSSNALDNLPIQGALIEAAVVKFAGNSGDLIENPPALDQSRTYIVKATCTKQEQTRRDDGEVRTTVTMKIDSCFERGKVPIVDEAQPSLYSVPADDAAEDGEADE